MKSLRQVLGTAAERVQWTQSARRSVGNGKERLRDYAGFPESAALTFPKRAAQIKKNRRGAEGDNCDSDTASEESLHLM